MSALYSTVYIVFEQNGTRDTYISMRYHEQIELLIISFFFTIIK